MILNDHKEKEGPMKLLPAVLLAFIAFSCYTSSITTTSTDAESDGSMKINNAAAIDYQSIKNGSIDIYSTDNIIEKTEGDAVEQNLRQSQVVDDVVELFRMYIPTAEPRYGKHELPPVYSGKITPHSITEMTDFLKKSSSDYVFIVKYITASANTQLSGNNFGGLPGQSGGLYVNNKNTVGFELWDSKTQKAVLDFDIKQTGHTTVHNVLYEAVNYIRNEGMTNDY